MQQNTCGAVGAARKRKTEGQETAILLVSRNMESTITGRRLERVQLLRLQFECKAGKLPAGRNQKRNKNYEESHIYTVSLNFLIIKAHDLKKILQIVDYLITILV